MKSNVCCGVGTNVGTAVSLIDGKADDSPECSPLVERTADVFDIDDVSTERHRAGG